MWHMSLIAMKLYQYFVSFYFLHEPKSQHLHKWVYFVWLFFINEALSLDFVYGSLIHCFARNEIILLLAFFVLEILCQSYAQFSRFWQDTCPATLSQNGLLKTFSMQVFHVLLFSWTIRRDTENPEKK